MGTRRFLVPMPVPVIRLVAALRGGGPPPVLPGGDRPAPAAASSTTSARWTACARRSGGTRADGGQPDPPPARPSATRSPTPPDALPSGRAGGQADPRRRPCGSPSRCSSRWGAGVVAAMNHVPATPSRPELTWAPTRRRARSSTRRPITSRRSPGRSSRSGRTGARRSRQSSRATSTRSTSSSPRARSSSARSTRRRKALDASLDAIPDVGNGSELRLSPEVQDRYDGLGADARLQHGLDDDWRTFTGRALDAANLNALLARHDQETAAAAQQGAQEKYPAGAAAARRLGRDDPPDEGGPGPARGDDRRLDAHPLDRARRAVRRGAPAPVRGARRRRRQGDQGVRAAFDGEQDARKRLPVDTRPLVMIMADVAQGGLNQVVISIEETRQSLADALRSSARSSRTRRPGRRVATRAIGSPSGREATYTHAARASRRRGAQPLPPGATLREDPPLRIRIVTGQPWDARADVLVVPVVGDPDFAGPLGEVDRRAGGELAALHAFGELRGKRYSTSLGSRRRAARLARRDGLGRSGRRARSRGRAQGRRDRHPAAHRARTRPRSPCGSTRSPPSTAASPPRRSSSRGAWSRARSSPRRSTARTPTPRRRRSTSCCSSRPRAMPGR